MGLDLQAVWDVINREAFIRANTEILSPPLVPEVRLHLAHESVPLWQKTEDELGEIGLPPPFWAFAWAGGQALARHVLDHPEIVRERRVIDLASGSGLVAIAALKAGAAHVLAADIDEFAVAAMGLNFKLNSSPRPPVGEVPSPAHAGQWRRGDDIPSPASLRYATSPASGRGEGYACTNANLLTSPAPPCDVILVGDLFYEKTLAEKVFAWLTEAHSSGTTIFIGDPGRSYLPKDKLTKLAEYNVPVTRDLEDAEIKRTSVWTLKVQIAPAPTDPSL